MGVKMLPKNGFLLIAGKGHENYQIIGTKKFPFSDREELENKVINDCYTKKGLRAITFAYRDFDLMTF
jgi:hypothetical protein